MHSDLLMLRVACRVVEGTNQTTASTAAAATTATTDDAKHFRMPRLVLPAIAMAATATGSHAWDARRIPSLRPRPTDAGMVLGLKRPRVDAARASDDDDDGRDCDEDGDYRDENDAQREDAQHQHKRVRRQSPSSAPPPPGVFMDSPLAKFVHAQRPPPPALPMRSPLGVEGMAGVVVASPDKSQTRVAPATFMSFISQTTTRMEDLQPQSQPQPQPQPGIHEEKLSPLESPRVSTLEPAAASTSLRVPTISQWRAPATAAPPVPQESVTPLRAARQSSPLPSLSTSRPTANMPPLALPASTTTTKPTLVRKSSAPWREAMSAQDRASTRERILRGLDRQCRGDYGALLQIVTALEEELLHAHTTSKDHYFFQTVALRDRVASLSPPRTARPQPPPPQLLHPSTALAPPPTSHYPHRL